MKKVKLYTDQYLEECLQNKHYLNGFRPDEVLVHCDVPERILRRNLDYLNRYHLWHHVSHYQVLSEKFIREYADYVHWSSICISQKLSDKFMIEFAHKIEWEEVCRHQYLKSSFIEQFKEHFDWDRICVHQYLKPKFIEKHFSEICHSYRAFENLLTYQHVTEKFLKEHKDFYKNDSYLIGKIILIKRLTKKFKIELIRMENEALDRSMKRVR